MFIADLTPSEASVLIPIRGNLENGDIPRVLQTMRSQTFPSSMVGPLHLLEIQALTEQGRLKDAFTRCEALLAHGSLEEPFHFELRLRFAFLKLFFQRSPQRAISAIRTLVNQTSVHGYGALKNQPGGSLIQALSYDLLSRAISLGVGWHVFPSSSLPEAKRLQDTAARLYAEGGAYSESISSLLALGQLSLLGSHATPALAQAVIAQAQAQALAWKLPYRHLEASLFLAELEQDHFNSSGSIKIGLYDKCMELALDCPHVLSRAFVNLSKGQRLIKASQDGTALILETIPEFERFDSVRGLYAALSALGAFHYQNGNHREAEQYFNKARIAAEQIGAPIFEIASKVALITLQIPKGNRAEIIEAARDIHRSTEACHAARIISSFTLSNVFAQLGLTSEAEKVGLASLRVLSRTGPSPTLALAYFFHGNTYASAQNWKVAYQFWKKALELEKQFGDISTQCQRYQCLALAVVMRALDSEDSDTVDIAYSQALRYLSRAEKLASTLDSAEHDRVRAGLDQMHGQLALLCDQLEEGLLALEGALGNYQKNGMLLSQGFTNAQLGLLRYQLGKTGDQASLLKAVHHQEAAYKIFSNKSMRNVSWRIAFHRALTEYRSACASDNTSCKPEGIQKTLAWLDISARDLEHFSRSDSDSLALASDATNGALSNLINDSSKVFEFAIQIHLQLMDNWIEALRWLERKIKLECKDPFYQSMYLVN